jgi:hypothetical protein
MAQRNPAALQSIDRLKTLTRTEQDAVSEAQGLLAGFGLLEELEGEGMSVPHNLLD